MVRALVIAALVALPAAVALLVNPILAHEGQERPAASSHGAPLGGTRSDPLGPHATLGAPVAASAVSATRRHHGRIPWRKSVAVGLPEDGRLVRGVRLPAGGAHYFTWDPILKRRPNRRWRRWATDDLIRTVLRVIRGYAKAHRGAPRVGIGDLSRPHGGDFGPQFGGIGHVTHQNGLDADVYYPLRSEAERAPLSVDEVNPQLAQDLVDRFVRAGAVVVYVGPNTGLTGSPDVVQAIPNHDNHLHVRIAG
jgi:Penicillin-insensitive murein endopeptidase